MNKPNGVIQRTSGYRGRRGILNRVSEEDLLFRFESGPAPDEQPLGHAPAEQLPAVEREPGSVHQEVLTLGGEPVLVNVLSESEAGDLLDSSASAERAAAQAEEAAEQLRRGRDDRHALEQMYDLIHTCEAEQARAGRADSPSNNVASVEAPVAAEQIPNPSAEQQHGHASVDHATPTQVDHATHATRAPTMMALGPGRRPVRRSRSRDARNRRTGHQPFHWRQFLVSAAVSSGLGAAALLIVYALGG